MLTIHLQNGDTIEMSKASYECNHSNGSTSYYTEKNGDWLGTLTANGDFISADYSNKHYRNTGFTVEDLIGRLEYKDRFNWDEREKLMRLKNLINQYKPKSGCYR